MIRRGATSLRTGDKLHVTLVRPPLVSRVGAFNNEAVPHLGLAYVAAAARAAGHDVVLFDGIAEGLNQVHPIDGYPGFQVQGIPLDAVVDRIPAETDVIGFSSMFSAEWVFVRQLIEKVRARFPDCLLVAGGEHFTALAEYSLRDCPALDVIVKGEGEQIFTDLLAAYASADMGGANREGDYADVPGVCFVDDAGEFRDNGGLPRIRAVDAIPRPYWPDGYLEKFWAAGKSYGVASGRDIPLLGTRGCPYRCTFCSSPQMWTTRYVMRDVADVIDEIKSYIAKYAITSFQFYDLTVFTKKRWTVEFCQRLLAENLNVRWSLPSGTRSEVMDEEVLTLLKATGCDYVAYAPESGSPRTLERIRKQVDLGKMGRSMRIAKKVGLTVRINLIIGFPFETRRDVWRTLLYGFRNAVRGVDEVPYFLFSPYPGTALFEELRASGDVTLNDAYFLSLISMNGKFSDLRPKLTTNPHVPAWELATLRLVFMLLNYGIGYLVYPARILRTLRNMTGTGGEAATVFEHRLRDAFQRGRADG